VIQFVSKNKLLFIIMVAFFAILSNFYLLGGANAQTNHLATDFWSQVINDISNQIITIKDHRSEYSLLYKLCKPLNFKFLNFNFSQVNYQIVRLLITWVPSILTSFGFFYLIYYQLSRTSSEESDPYHFSYRNLDN
jgi:hypothetical protein